MNRSTKIAWLLIIGLSTASGCRQAKVAPVPPPTVVSQNQTSHKAEEIADDSNTNIAGSTSSPDEDANGEGASKEGASREDASREDASREDASREDAADPTADPPSPSDVTSSTTTEDGATQDSAADNEIAKNGEAEEATGDSPEDPGSAASTEVGTVTPESTETPQARSSERFALLTAGGPLVVDVIITIDGDVHSAALEELVEDAFEAADTDGDGERTWEEVANSPKFMYGQFGNLPITDDAQKRQLITMYDRNENGLVDRDELPRFVTRNVGRARSFSLRSSNEFRSDNRSRSPIRRLLDADHNGAITPEEMAAAPSRLLSLDADDDQIITLTDLKNDAQAMPGQMSNRRRTSEPDTAFLIDDRLKWAYASFALEELYAFGDSVGVSDWPLTPELFATLDVDDDERLDRKEVEQLATVKPHVRLLAQFGVKDGEDGPRTTSLKLDFIDPSIEAAVIAVRTHPRRVSIELDHVEIEFFVNEDPSLSNYEEVAKGQFNAFDTDGNGYLEEDEIPDQLPGFDVPFAGVDANADGKVYLDELASFLELRQRAYRGQVRARAADQEDALFTALDTSGDGRLHAREIAATPTLLAKMDLNQDGNLQSHEIPRSMVVGFVRGNPQQDNTLFVMPTGASDVSDEDLPRWFLGMDTNRDGEVGVHEFLGTAERFATLDKNGDGFINPAELPSSMVSPTTTKDAKPAEEAEAGS